MIDPVQAVLLFVIILLSILLVVLGVQVFLILREFKGTIRRANKVLDNTGVITEGISEPVSLISNLFSNTSTLGAVAKFIKILSHKDKKNK